MTRTLQMIGAELLKLRRRRSLFWTTLAGTVGATLIAWASLAILHASDPDRYEAAGSLANFEGVISVLGAIGGIVAIVVGATAGAGDERAGLFRDLVATGRSRRLLFGVRLPGVLLFLAPFVATSIALTIAAARIWPDTSPIAWAELAAGIGYLVAALAFGATLGLGLASLLGSRATAIGIGLGWQLVLGPLLAAWGTLGDARTAFSTSALGRLAPGDEGGVAMSVGLAAAVLLAWGVVLLGAGLWRTVTRDA